jgi:hypothetical protein
MHRGHRSTFHPCVFIAHEIINPAHVAAHGAGREKIEKQPDEVVADQVREWRFNAQWPRQRRPANRADRLCCQVNQQRYRDIGKLRGLEGLQKPFNVNAREKISHQADADQQF